LTEFHNYCELRPGLRCSSRPDTDGDELLRLVAALRRVVNLVNPDEASQYHPVGFDVTHASAGNLSTRP
jgi:hypothetical protein